MGVKIFKTQYLNNWWNLRITTCRNVCAHSLDLILSTALWPRSNRPTTHVILRQEMLVQFWMWKVGRQTWSTCESLMNVFLACFLERSRGHSPRSCCYNFQLCWQIVCGDEEDQWCSSGNPTALGCPAERRSETRRRWQNIKSLGFRNGGSRP